MLSTCAENAQVQFEGARQVKRKIKIYNLDMIIGEKWSKLCWVYFILNSKYFLTKINDFYYH